MSRVAILLCISLALFGAAKKPVVRRLQCEAITAKEIAAREKEWADAQKQTLANVRMISRDQRGFELYATPNGQFWLPGGNGDTILRLIAEQSLDWHGDGDQMVRRGDVVIDAGAGVGVFTRVALDLGASRVIALETSPDNLECLRRTFDSELSDGRVQIIPVGAADTNTTQNGVRFMSLDNLLDIVQVDHVDFIRVNAPGAESRVLKGAQRLLHSKPRVSMLIDRTPDGGSLAERLLLQGNATYTLECSRWNITRGVARPAVLWFR